MNSKLAVLLVFVFNWNSIPALASDTVTVSPSVFNAYDGSTEIFLDDEIVFELDITNFDNPPILKIQDVSVQLQFKDANIPDQIAKISLGKTKVFRGQTKTVVVDHFIADFEMIDVTGHINYSYSITYMQRGFVKTISGDGSFFVEVPRVVTCEDRPLPSRGRSIILVGDSWANQSSAQIAGISGCPVVNKTFGGSTAESWVTRLYRPDVIPRNPPDRTSLEEKILALPGPVMVWLSTGGADDLATLMDPDQYGTFEQNAGDVATFVNQLLELREDLYILHAGYNLTTPDGFRFFLTDQCSRYEFRNMRHLDPLLRLTDPFHLTFQGYLFRVWDTYGRSQMAKAVGTCSP